MASSRKPGPIGLSSEPEDFNDGTMIRALSPRPGPISTDSIPARGHHRSTPLMSTLPKVARRKVSTAAIQVLRQGNRGSEVQKLQRQLNVRLASSPNLAVDGIFGPITQQAVLQYQKGVSIAADGVVGKQTWYHLLKGNKATVFQAPVRTPQSSTSRIGAAPKSPTVTPVPSMTTPLTSAPGVWEWPLEDKFAEALCRTVPKLPGSMRHEFGVLLSPQSLSIMAGTLVVWAGSHAFGVGEVVDVVLLIGGAFFLGMAAFDVAGELGDFLVVTSTATDAKDLDEAASHLARAIAIMGVAAFIALLAKIAHGRGGRSVSKEAPPKPKSESKTTRSKARQEPIPESKATEPKPSEKPESESKAVRKAPNAHTEPTGSLGGKPSGKRTAIPEKADRATARSLDAENKSADRLAEAGYKVEQNPQVLDSKNPDYLIEGRRFDCKAPETARPRNAASELEKAVRGGQADRIVLNLEESPIQLDAMKQQLSNYPIEGLKEVIVIKDGQVVPFWP